MKQILNCACSKKFADLAPLLLRVVVGAIFLVHGWEKFVGGVPGIEAFLAGMNFPVPGLLAVLLIAAEIGGGILLILGAFTHWVAKVLAFVALVALVAVHLPNGFTGPGGYEFILLILVSCISIVITGPGKISVDARMKRK
ncbi:MAG TPA: DoxX family protein [Candidatus Paceibacterota bacterium]|nr:DoxX family protein [Candidatus Paceibacterota bacterium]